jgi:hypothetical protein
MENKEDQRFVMFSSLRKYRKISTFSHFFELDILHFFYFVFSIGNYLGDLEAHVYLQWVNIIILLLKIQICVLIIMAAYVFKRLIHPNISNKH